MDNETPTNQSIREQGAWLLVAKVIGFALSFALPLMVVRFMALDQVGHYREAFQVITNAVIILPLGFSMSVYYFLARETTRRGAAILNILIFNFVTGGLACLTLWLYPQIIGNLFQSPELTRLAPSIGVVIWIWIFSTFLETVAIANQEMRVATVFIILAQFTKTLMMGAAVIAFSTVEAFIYAAMIQGVIQIAVLLSYLRTRFPGFWRQFDPAFFRQQTVYAIPYGLAGILWMAQNDIHNYFAGYKFSSADFAIYAYGCFEVPLIAMLSESVTSVLIPRMNALQLVGNRGEMIRLTVRAMQKLAFFYFPAYIFLLITSKTFIVTMFGPKYEASASIFVINLTILPFSILVNDPVVRSFKELGRFLLITRILVLMSLVAVLYYGLDSFGMTGMISAAVGAILVEKCIAQAIVVRVLGLGWGDLLLLKNVVKTAVVSLAAGALTYLVYINIHDTVLDAGIRFASFALGTTKITIVNFVGGCAVLMVSGLVFAPVYLIGTRIWGLIEEEEMRSIKEFVGKFLPRRAQNPMPEPRV